MSHGHADKIIGQAAGNTPPIDPALYRRDDVRGILVARDIAALYRLLKDEGITQRTIAALTGQSQSEVSEILTGRKVLAYDVLVRIAQGLRIPRELMGLSYGNSTAYRGDEVTVADTPEGVDEEMRRRAVLLTAPVALWGRPLFGAVPELPAPPWVPEVLPSRLGMADVTRIEHQSGFLRALARQHGGHADAARALVTHSTRLMSVPADDRVKAKLAAALAQQHTLAGWCCADSLLDSHAAHHFRQAVELAGQAGDSYQMVITLRVAGNADRLGGHPNDALKLYQLALLKLMGRPSDNPQAAVLTSWLHVQSALALAAIGIEDQVRSSLAEAHDGWDPPDDFARADFDQLIAQVHLDLGRLDIAEQFASASVQTSGRAGHHVAGAVADVTLATIHVKAAEPDGILLAKTAIGRMSTLSSPRSRQRLVPLAAALDARPGADARHLARMARQVATVRA